MITKKLYKDCVLSILDFNRKDLEYYSTTNGLIDFMNFEELNDLIMKFILLLEYCTKEEHDKYYSSNLQYFLYELNGGKDYTSGTITDENGKDIECKSIDDLWNNFIISSHPEVEDKEAE